ncbi:hypothetical protein EMIHUDRAFT_210596 [Emiliania huxleyi CCMP1516]|uniref:Uncharacterized protein n=2 Tax=Emiliania huxleyi TaxID=2903 RepID=A0A0D3IYC9_EMIH1|nr:hypothetical protein EMIHUDRAFT_210596 [Emiliania huxleyi CCMP1516]EOD16264.1 hypothetical protein EMIHUDRAFT_210596 [Emiliania huxleyi CCMP1516]|eukprot:XP_005768693.1 hypothetical protein EMIHUDRAFT_210596 [Emiliania huxleyi CCMP1516]
MPDFLKDSPAYGNVSRAGDGCGVVVVQAQRTTRRPSPAMRPAQSDLVNILSSLEAHWHVLEAEVVEIGSDIEHCKLCSKKYGDWFDSPLQFLQELQRTKKEKM